MKSIHKMKSMDDRKNICRLNDLIEVLNQSDAYDILSEKIKGLYMTEFEENFHNILLEKSDIFLGNLTKKVKYQMEETFSVEIFRNCANMLVSNEKDKKFTLNELIKRHEEITKKEYYEPNFKILSSHYTMFENKLTSSPNKRRNIEIIPYFTNFRKHCKQTEEAVHICNERMIKISDEKNNLTHILCIRCKMGYLPNCIQLYCKSCDVDYFSCIPENENENLTLQPATWESYHCGAIINDKMLCIKCKGIFYLNCTTGKLECQNANCKFIANPKNIQWVCIICKQEFKSEAKIYNPLEFKNIKTAIKDCIFMKHLAKPKNVPCCNKINLNINSITFTHRKDCDGVLYRGELDKKTIVVCEKCKSMNFYEKYIWTCPSCFKRFRQKLNKTLPSENTGQDSPCKEEFSSNELNSPSNLNLSNSRRNSQVRFYDQNADGDSLVKRKIDHRNSAVNQKSKISMFNEEKAKSALNLPKFSPEIRRRNHQFDINQVNSDCPFSLNLINASIDNKNEDNSKNINSRGSGKPNFISKNLFDLKNITIEEEMTEKDPDDKKHVINSSRSNMKSDSVVQNNNENANRSPINIANLNIINVINVNASPLKNFKISPLKNIKQMDLHKIGEHLNIPNLADLDINEEKTSNGIRESENTNETNDTDTSKPSSTDEFRHKNDLFRFNIEEFPIKKQIGEGSYGKIYLVEHIKTKESFAMKKIIAHNKKEVEEFKSEYELMNTILEGGNMYCKEYILKIYGISIKELDTTTWALYVLMELANSDWEKEIMYRSSIYTYYSEQDLLMLMKRVINTFAEMQKENISHRDIKPQNILIFKKKSFKIYKIADFGEAKEMRLNKQNNTIRGTELYMSPILFQSLRNGDNINFKSDLNDYKNCKINHNSYKSDVFSLGYCLLLAATLTFKSLYDIRELQDMHKIAQIINKNLKERYSSKLISLIIKMVETNEKYRPDFIELQNNINTLV